jgi:dipeptidyl aminopeptidase/acylaminoacyl peptidase
MVRTGSRSAAVPKIAAVWLSVVSILLLASAALAPPARAAGRPLALEDLFKIARISDPALSPDGRLVAYTVTTADLEANETASDIWIAPVDGGPARALTTHPTRDRRPAWSPDGRTIAFESKRSGDWQIWLIERDGGEARQFTKIATEASLPVWSPDGARLAFVSSVFPEHSAKPFRDSDALNRALLEAKEKSKVKARLYEPLVQHWDEWNDGRCSTCSSAGAGATGRPDAGRSRRSADRQHLLEQPTSLSPTGRSPSRSRPRFPTRRRAPITICTRSRSRAAPRGA